MRCALLLIALLTLSLPSQAARKKKGRRNRSKAKPTAPKTPQAAADDPTEDSVAQAIAHYEEGTRLFEAGRYADAAKRFQLAYNLDPSPVLLYNLARAHEEAGHDDEAVVHFKSYLARYPEAEDRPAVEARIQALEKGEEPASTGLKALFTRWRLSALITLMPDGSLSLADPGFGDLSSDGVAVTEPDLGLGFGLALSAERELTRGVYGGARLGWSATELSDDLGLTLNGRTSQVRDGGQVRFVDLGALLRGAFSIDTLTLEANLYGGLTLLTGELAVPLPGEEEGDTSISGTGLHLGGALGVAWPLSARLTGLARLGLIHQRASLESDPFTGLSGGEGRLTADRLSTTRLMLTGGVAFGL